MHAVMQAGTSINLVSVNILWKCVFLLTCCRLFDDCFQIMLYALSSILKENDINLWKCWRLLRCLQISLAMVDYFL